MSAPEGLLDELRAKVPRSLRVASLLCILSFVSFAAIDPLLVVGHSVTVAWAVRGVLVTIFLALMGVSLLPDFSRRWAHVLMAGCAVTAGMGVNVLTFLTGGGESEYYTALIIVFFAFALLPSPWKRTTAGALFVGLALAYDLLMVMGGRMGELPAWVSHNAVIWAAALIAGSLYHFAMGLREDDYANRRRLAEANDRLQALDKAKSRFFANVSHELRTPLTLSLAPVQALLEEPEERLDEGQRDQLQLVERNGLRLLRLVDDLLELSKAEAASLKLRSKRLDLRDFVSQLVEQIAPLAARKQLQLVLEDAPPLEPVAADPDHLERVLLNLVGNAIKFTPEGGRIVVRVREEGGRAWVEVEDNGPGIPSDQLEEVFERFHQVDASSTRVHGGTGIGLALVKELVELHGGEAYARSKPGEGTKVGFWIPGGAGAAAEPEEAPATPVNEVEGLPEWHDALRRQDAYRLRQIQDATERRLAPRAPAGTRSHTVLVIEDNADMIRFVGTLLSAEHHVLTATDGYSGLRLAFDRRPDIIVSDVMMPGLNGYELVERLRDEPATRGIPVILLTARGGKEDRIVGRKSGADAYLTKPFQAAELSAAVRTLLNQRGALKATAEAQRVESVQYLAGGVVQELKRPLDTLATAVAQLESTSATEALQELRSAIADLDSLARSSTAPREPTKVDALVQEVLPGDDQPVRVVSELRSHAEVPVRRAELQRALKHLLSNAIQATRAGGRVTVRTWDEPEGGVAISVSDEGPGIASEHADRIFQPFYSTQPGGRGMGLPLARKIIEGHGGRLDLSTGGPGAMFVVHLPAE